MQARSQTHLIERKVISCFCFCDKWITHKHAESTELSRQSASSRRSDKPKPLKIRRTALWPRTCISPPVMDAAPALAVLIPVVLTPGQGTPVSDTEQGSATAFHSLYQSMSDAQTDSDAEGGQPPAAVKATKKITREDFIAGAAIVTIQALNSTSHLTAPLVLTLPSLGPTVETATPVQDLQSTSPETTDATGSANVAAAPEPSVVLNVPLAAAPVQRAAASTTASAVLKVATTPVPDQPASPIETAPTATSEPQQAAPVSVSISVPAAAPKPLATTNPSAIQRPNEVTVEPRTTGPEARRTSESQASVPTPVQLSVAASTQTTIAAPAQPSIAIDVQPPAQSENTPKKASAEAPSNTVSAAPRGQVKAGPAGNFEALPPAATPERPSLTVEHAISSQPVRATAENLAFSLNLAQTDAAPRQAIAVAASFRSRASSEPGQPGDPAQSLRPIRFARSLATQPDEPVIPSQPASQQPRAVHRAFETAASLLPRTEGLVSSLRLPAVNSKPVPAQPAEFTRTTEVRSPRPSAPPLATPGPIEPLPANIDRQSPRLGPDLSWNSVSASSYPDVRSAMPPAEPSQPAPASLVQPLDNLQPLPLETPKPQMSSQILLHLANTRPGLGRRSHHGPRRIPQRLGACTRSRTAQFAPLRPRRTHFTARSTRLEDRRRQDAGCPARAAV